MYSSGPGQGTIVHLVILGAAGSMGRTAVAHLAAMEGVAHLVLADRDGGALDEVARTIGGPGGRTTVAEVDVADADGLARVLGPADLVVNCAGPFFLVGPRALEAAIDTGTHYVDICDDPGPTTEMLAMDDRARRAGVVAVVGMGASPGLSNLLARRAAGHLDEVEDCYTAWPLDVDGGPVAETPPAPPAAEDGVGPPAAVIHLMEQIHDTIAVVERGHLVQRRPLDTVTLRYPGFGEGSGYTVGHPEPLTLLSSLGIAGRSANLMLLDTGVTAAFLRGLQADLDGGALDLEGAAAALLDLPHDRIEQALTAAGPLPGAGDLPPFFALARGRAGGRDVVVGCHLAAFPRGMAEITSIPAALAVGQFIEELPPPGVHPPEAVVDGDRLLEALRPFCQPVVPSVAALAPVVVDVVDPGPGRP